MVDQKTSEIIVNHFLEYYIINDKRINLNLLFQKKKNLNLQLVKISIDAQSIKSRYKSFVQSNT